MCTEYRPHTNTAGETYCQYTIKSKNPNNSNGFQVGDKICILCKKNQAGCPTIDTFYRYPITYTFNLEHSTICGECESENYYEEGHDGGSKAKTVSKMTQKRKELRKKYQKKNQLRKKELKEK